ncbi:M3 family oligoendopeptidase [Camelimonas abortus]|uniref:M3 family oligoendopeptidase n=1 Tax=Camelimonas abortus TaxID=1017184 RepID=A0ABV7LEJ9_9HYPH
MSCAVSALRHLQLPVPAASAAAAAGGAAAAPDLGALPRWDLSALYPGMDSPEYRADFEAIEGRCAAFAGKWRGRVAELAATPEGQAQLDEAIGEYEAISDQLGRIMSYAGLIYFGDTSDPANAKFYGDAQERVTAASVHLLFFQLELNRLDDGLWRRLRDSAAMARWRPWLDDLRKEKPYQLSDDIERLFHEKSVTGVSAWNRLFDETIAALRFEVDGESLPIEPTLNLLQDADPGKRRSAAAAISSVFAANLRTFVLVTNTLAKDKEISDRWRGFADVADSRHLANRVEREVVDAMVAAVRAACPRLSHRYYALKARWFGVERLNYWDRNAPLPESSQRVIGWEEARDTVLAAYGEFSPEMARIARRFFDENWIDAPARPGKAPGAFAHPTVPSAHPYVLLNYLGKPRDVMTLAHELGHGVHQVLAARQGALMAPTPLTLAETASVFGEMLTFRRMLDQAPPAERRIMLASKVEDMLNTVVRQVAFYTFERKVHEARRNGELTAGQINAFWMEVQSESLGPAIRLDEEYGVWWAYIPHFIHSPFYVYAYAFGDCLVNSLYGVYRKAGDGFAARYLEMLAAGGTKHHSELLAPFGLDAADPAFWRIGLGMIDDFITELEQLSA